jgi:acetyltransferase-like isoleucine patch superfamily enzyme
MTLEKIKSRIQRIIEDPEDFLFTVAGLVRGLGYWFYYNVFRKKITIGFPFIVNAKVRIIGPGTVSIGKGCRVLTNAFKGLTIVTYSPDAVVRIGDKCNLGGTTIRSFGTVEIGDRTMTAISLIQDRFFVHGDRPLREAVRRLPGIKRISLGKNVWLGEDSFVLSGSTIGDDSVISSGSWCHDAAYPDYVLLMGNPIRSAIPIEKLLRLKGEL